MENINIAELLKDCPLGMELESTIFENVKLKYVSEYHVDFPICIETISGLTYHLTKYGQISCSETAKCVIFPKNGRNWEGFQRPFKEGDVIFGDNGGCSYITIFKGYRDRYSFNYYVSYTSFGRFHINDYADSLNLRLATEKERQKFFEVVKHRGYQWNEETKTLEKLIKPKFKVGDVVQDKDGYKVEITSVDIDDDYYTYQSKIVNGIGAIVFKDQDEWELVSNKFDISTLVPFETKVLVRNTEENIWKPAIFGCYVDKTFHYYVLGGTCWSYCIPYEGNEHLRGKIDDCDKFYQTWKE